jgi:hypothetical protein
MLDELSSEDLTYWQAYDYVRPIDASERIIEQIAALCCIHGAKSKIDDFMPWELERDSGEEIEPEALVRSMPGGEVAGDIVADELAELEAWQMRQRNKG